MRATSLCRSSLFFFFTLFLSLTIGSRVRGDCANLFAELQLEKNTLTFNDVLQSPGLDSQGFLKKESFDVDSLKLDPTLQPLLITLEPGTRDFGHICRLLDPVRSEVEKKFAKAILRNSFLDFDKLVKIGGFAAVKVIKGEGADTTMWWTFSPYVFEQLMTKGGTELQALTALAKWASGGKVDLAGNSVHLSGLEAFNEFSPNTYVLDRNPNNITHQFTSKEAQRIVKIVPVFSER